MGKYNDIKSAIDKCSENLIFTSFDKIIFKNDILRRSNETVHKKIDKKAYDESIYEGQYGKSDDNNTLLVILHVILYFILKVFYLVLYIIFEIINVILLLIKDLIKKIMPGIENMTNTDNNTKSHNASRNTSQNNQNYRKKATNTQKENNTNNNTHNTSQSMDENIIYEDVEYDDLDDEERHHRLFMQERYMNPDSHRNDFYTNSQDYDNYYGNENDEDYDDYDYDDYDDDYDNDDD